MIDLLLEILKLIVTGIIGGLVAIWGSALAKKTFGWGESKQQGKGVSLK